MRVEDVPIPRVGPGEVLLRVSWYGICGTEREEYRDGPVVIPVDRPNALTGQCAPVTLGHEFAGEVIEVGPEVPVRSLITRRIALDRIVTDGFAALEAGGSDIKVLVSTRASGETP